MRTLFTTAISLCLLFLIALPATALAVDWDGDGDPAPPLGGDCDDHDPRRYSGAAEWCDLDNVDEDCDSSTFFSSYNHDGDDDGDGFISNQCCNGSNCGDDCDDTRRLVNPGSPDVCNGRDDNCDGTVDWDNASGYVNVLAYIDSDQDGWGAGGSLRMCQKDLVTNLRTDIYGDCNDKAASIHPSASEACNGLDDNCNGEKDEGLSGACN